ncbi:GNAT family N-acetyltransferase [Maribacter arenosus]|uniref:GNAT family N-acetyltransferase n=1 Tax=Maribacter arenosus TaxID=1854708 RepID=A0ABR7VJK7_9FLAO|nr:GNAT family N-acetyltransferase [Maribacter arenosus]MBD0852332.1 GNAT family N-acetyltransferase [Maribacter arenosus]
MDTIHIRSATQNDLKVLRTFEQGVIKAERPFDVTLDADPITYYDLGELIQNDNALVVVAETNGTVIASGFALVKPAKHYLDHDHFAYLGFMYTRPEYRGKGVNARIVERLKQWSFAKGLKEIRLTVYNDNQSAIKAYEKVGFKKHIITMRLA